MIFIGLFQVDASVFAMLKGLIVVITAFLSYVILNKQFYRHHIFSICLIFCGITIVGYSSIDTTENTENTVVGLVLIATS